MPEPLPFFVEILKKHLGDKYADIYKKSSLLQYLAIKTRSVGKSSKSRANLGNLYAIYVLVEDYIAKGYNIKNDYTSYEGAKFSVIFKRQRELPFGSKLQNHHLNNRCNDEFRKFFKQIKDVPIIRDLDTKRYWINQKLLIVAINSEKENISEIIIDIIDTYASLRSKKFASFFKICLDLQEKPDNSKIFDFIKEQLNPNIDARIFEIVSFCVLKSYYALQSLTLYKTGRTNANDGGIDFVMRPVGRFFQVSEVLDFKKYFLDIDKILHFPITFVIKSDKSPKKLKKIIKEKANNNYDKKTLNRYMESIEEIISIPILNNQLREVIKKGKSKQLLKDLILYYRIEFNIPL